MGGMTHQQAREALLTLIEVPSDVSALTVIVSYIEQQERMDRWDSVDVARIAGAAERRSDEALARIVTLAADVRELRAVIMRLPGAAGLTK